MEGKVKEHTVGVGIGGCGFDGWRWRFGFGDGCSDDRHNGLSVVPSRAKVVKEFACSSFAIILVGAERVDPADHAVNHTVDYAWWMSRVHRYIQMLVARLFEEGRLYFVTIDREGQVHEIDFVWAVSDLPGESIGAVKVSRECVPFFIVVLTNWYPDAEDVVNESSVEVQVRSMALEHFLLP